MTDIPVSPVFKGHKTAITLQSSDFYVPYTAVTIQSIIGNSTKDNYYDIVIITKDMTEDNEKKLSDMTKDYSNISVRAVNVNDLVDKYIHVNDERYGGMSLTRILLPVLLADYDRCVNMDCDMIALHDLADIYQYNITDYYMAAVPDIYVFYMYHTKYLDNGYLTKAISGFLELDSPKDYCNAGFMYLNLSKIRNDFDIRDIYNFITDNNCKYFEQDAINHFFRNKILKLDYSWNYLQDTRQVVSLGNQKIYTEEFAKYQNAAHNKRNIHYATVLKPWNAPQQVDSGKWWAYAQKTPFYDEIVARNIDESGSHKVERILFVCETIFQLVNILNIKLHMYPNVEADLAFTMTTDFTRYVEPLKKHGIFKNIYISEYRVAVDMCKIRESAPNTTIMKNPDGYEHALPIEGSYSDYFMTVAASPFQKIVYYQLVKRGGTRVHFFEDGSDTYITNIKSTIARDVLDHSIYKEKDRFINNIVEMTLYEPELYSGGDKIRLSVVPKISVDDKLFVDILHDVFGECIMPKEKYIYFNECFTTDMIASNDIEILDRIAEIVGKENITVKLHPRANYGEELYELHGYRIFAENVIPWEVFALSAEMNDKVLISVSSNTLINPYIVFGKDVSSIYLWKVMKLSRRAHVRNPAYQTFFNKVMKLLNSKSKNVFFPSTMYELKEIINYLEGEI